MTREQLYLKLNEMDDVEARIYPDKGLMVIGIGIKPDNNKYPCADNAVGFEYYYDNNLVVGWTHDNYEQTVFPDRTPSQVLTIVKALTETNLCKNDTSLQNTQCKDCVKNLLQTTKE